MRYDKGIYVDSDTILMGDIGELYDKDLGDNVIAGRVDPKVAMVPEFVEYVEKALDVPHKEYINSGVLLMDLKKLRALHYITKMTDLIKEDADLVAPDQDYLNVLCRGKILHIDPSWNADPSAGIKGAKLVHFNLFKKPWQCDNVDGEEIFWDAAEKSGYYHDLLKKKKLYSVNDIRVKEAQVGALIIKAGKLAKVKEPIIKDL